MITAKDIAKIDRLYSDPGKHTRAAFARNATGGGVSPRSEDAVAWCMWGACYKTGVDMIELRTAMVEAGVIEPGISLVLWNDSHVFADIKTGLNKAMLFLKERELGAK